MDQQLQTEPARERVAVSSRLFPLASYAIVALAGAIGSVYMLRVVSAMRDSANQGIGGIGSGMSSAGGIVNAGLYLGLTLGLVGIIFALVRMFTTNAKASAPAWVFLLPGLLALVAPTAVYLASKAIMDPMLDRDAANTGTFEELASYVTILSIASIACGVFAILASLVLAFAPLNSARNKKVGALAVLILLELAFLLVVVMMFLYSVSIRRAATAY